MRRGRSTVFLAALAAIALACTLGRDRAAAEDKIQLENLKVTHVPPQGPAPLRVDLVIVGDGYVKDDFAQGSAWQVDTERLLHNFFLKEPFKSHRQLFNVHLVEVVSLDRGADGDPDKKPKRTAFGSSYNDGGKGRLLVPGDTAAVEKAARNVPDADVVLLLVNDQRFGGSGGKAGKLPCPVCSTDGTAFLTAIHELGHSFAGLGDEYPDEGMVASKPLPASGDLEYPNVQLAKLVDTTSEESLVKTLKWGRFFRNPGAFAELGRGYYEGGYYREKGVYRPAQVCAMSTEAGGTFCYVCNEEMLKAIYRTCRRGPGGGLPVANVAEARGAAAAAWELYEQGKLGKVVAELKKLGSRKLAAKDQEDVDALRKGLAESLEAGLSQLDELLKESPAAAKEFFALLQDAFRGTEWAKNVEARKKDMR